MPFKHRLFPPFLDRSWWDSLDYPSTLWDQHFGTVLTDEDFCHPVVKQGYLIRPRTRAAIRSSGKSEVVNDETKFLVKLSVSDFEMSDLDVKLWDNHVIIEGKHEDRADEYGSVERKFSRRYVLPADSDSKAIKCTLNAKGTLAIKAPKLSTDLPPPTEIRIPITFVEATEDKD